jgi:hypothetical protein
MRGCVSIVEKSWIHIDERCLINKQSQVFDHDTRKWERIIMCADVRSIEPTSIDRKFNLPNSLAVSVLENSARM